MDDIIALRKEWRLAAARHYMAADPDFRAGMI